MNRRNFLSSTSAAVISGGLAATTGLAISEPFPRTGPARLRLGLAAYSFRKHFSWMKGKAVESPESPGMDMKGFLDYCAKHGAGGAELTSYFFPGDADAAYFADIRRHAHLCGVEVSGTAVGNNFSNPEGSDERKAQMDYVKQWIDNAALMGAPHIRVFAGKHPKGVDEASAEKFAASALEEAGEYAGKQGIFLGIENHDSIADSGRLLRIIRAVDSPWVGVNLDTGNFRTENPYKDIEESAPYAVNVQVKVHMRTQKEDADLERIGKILTDSGYQGYLVLEYEEDGNPYEEVPAILDRMRKFCSL